MITFQCENCGRRIRVAEQHAGKKGKCPGCGGIVTVPSEPPLELAADEPAADLSANTPDIGGTPASMPRRGRSVPNISARAEHQAKAIPHPQPRDKPYTLMTILTYPASLSGIINMLIFWLLPVLLYAILAAFLYGGFYSNIIIGIAEFFVVAYMYYYLTDCVRDSATGSATAPENIARQPSRGEALEQYLQVVAGAVIFWGPLTAYWSFTQRTDAIFWLLLAYGVFFFPMGILAIIMFDSMAAYNPLLWIMSIFSTFVPYCVLILMLAIPVCLLVMTMGLVPNPVLAWLAMGAIWIYLAMIQAHLLGRFYYRNARKLNWEV